MFFQKYKEKQFFCGYNILTEGVFLTQLSSNVGISVWWFVWVMTNCYFMSDMFALCMFMWACVPLFDSEASEWEARFYQIHSKYMLLLNELQMPESSQNSPRFRELVAQLVGDSVTGSIPSLRWVSISLSRQVINLMIKGDKVMGRVCGYERD
jgi:hypothetical protein